MEEDYTFENSRNLRHWGVGLPDYRRALVNNTEESCNAYESLMKQTMNITILRTSTDAIGTANDCL